MKAKKYDWGKLTTLFVLIGLCTVLAVALPSFRTSNNIINVLQQITINAIMAVGMTFVIITGGIDLSVGSVLAFSSVVMGTITMQYGLPYAAVGLVVCILVGAACGALSGALITIGKLPPFIATLGVMNIARGLALALTGGRTINGFSSSFRWLGLGTIPGLNIPIQVLFMLLLFGIAYYVLSYRQTGRFIYAIGGNEEVTRLSGIRVGRYKMLVYIVSGITAGLAAFILASKLGAAQPIAGEGAELDAIAATVIGGASLTGGIGSIWGTLLGAMIIGVINNGLNLLNVSSYLQTVIIGVIIILSVLLDMMRRKK